MERCLKYGSGLEGSTPVQNQQLNQWRTKCLGSIENEGTHPNSLGLYLPAKGEQIRRRRLQLHRRRGDAPTPVEERKLCRPPDGPGWPEPSSSPVRCRRRHRQRAALRLVRVGCVASGCTCQAPELNMRFFGLSVRQVSSDFQFRQVGVWQQKHRFDDFAWIVRSPSDGWIHQVSKLFSV